ncbi:MAG TPA: glycerophosphodiester phosphodiesterase family protein [Terriglobia bacterium]|nr:glycerophosphodiester phosphodiesterase family protein [Terriglobia bacterium]
MIIFGHRGAPGYPRYGENTIACFNKALQAGAGGLEFDVRRCGDGRIVVIHDDTIDRTTNGQGRVAGLSYDQLKVFDAGFGEPVPLLSDVLDRFGARCLLNIELKDEGIAPDVKKLVLERRLERQVIVSAFEWGDLPPLAPEIPIALLTSKVENLFMAARELGAAAIHPRKDIVAASLVAAAREAQLRIHVWTVNEPAEVSRLRQLGVDGIFTDFPERCLTFVS